MPGRRSRFWVITINNPTLDNEAQWKWFKDLGATFLAFQKEQAPSGTIHYQGYLEMDKPCRLTKFKNALEEGMPMPHFEPRRGTQSQAVDYATKEETRLEGPWLYGEPSEDESGRRTDLERFSDAIKDGLTIRELVERGYVKQLAQYPQLYGRLSSIYRPKRMVPPSIVLLYGPPGVGKSRYVFDMYGVDPEFYTSPIDSNGFWMDGYDKHKFVLLDDFSGGKSSIKLPSLLRLLDRYSVSVPIKGSHVWWCPDEIYITTNYHPKEWYDWSGRGSSYNALMRRFTSIICWSHERDGPTFLSPSQRKEFHLGDVFHHSAPNSLRRARDMEPIEFAAFLKRRRRTEALANLRPSPPSESDAEEDEVLVPSTPHCSPARDISEDEAASCLLEVCASDDEL